MQAYLSAYAVILQCPSCHALVYAINANGVCLLVQCCFFSDIMYNGINRWMYFREKSTLGNFIKKKGVDLFWRDYGNTLSTRFSHPRQTVISVK